MTVAGYESYQYETIRAPRPGGSDVREERLVVGQLTNRFANRGRRLDSAGTLAV
jgi:hypothetical protein